MPLPLACAVLLAAFATPPATLPLLSLEDGIPGTMHRNAVEASLVDHEGQPALAVAFSTAEWPNVFFRPDAAQGHWDWSDWTGIRFHLHNPGPQAITAAIRIDNAGDENWLTHADVVPPGDSVMESRFNTAAREVFWGMRGVPELGPLPMGIDLDLSRIVAFQLFLPRPTQPHTLIITGIELFGPGASAAQKTQMPFVDRFGQYRHADWPGKLADEDALAARHEAEAAAIAAETAAPDRGWLEGPQLEATGWFRLEQLDGRWWLVTPDGHLFWSSGINCITTGDHSFIEGRAPWFEWLPDEDSPYARHVGQVEGAHSMADPVGGQGRTINFHAVNLQRKHGDDWGSAWRTLAYDRLRHWGINTIGNWSQWNVLDHSPIPFTVSANITGVRLLEGGRGYWRNMTDVFAENFPERAAQAVSGPAGRFGNTPLCIGYFVDNELSWAHIADGTLASPPDQPARIAFVERLIEQYGTIEALNAAWVTEAADWDALRLPANRNAAAETDRIAFERAFAARYFSVVQDAVHRIAPNQLYLGCRFAGAAEPHIMEAAAEHSEVISINAYFQSIDKDSCAAWNDWGRPVIIGEFHFGALDRGMFHGGLSPVATQADRAEAYRHYIESALACPAVIGAHWFQYVDQPITGRWYDGENYNIGFVDITDTPYPEMVEAAQAVHRTMYPHRMGSR